MRKTLQIAGLAICRSAMREKKKGRTGSADPEHALTGRI